MFNLVSFLKHTAGYRRAAREAEHAAKRLKSLGREVEYLCFEDEGHMIIKQKNRIEYILTAAEFLKSHLLQK